MKIRVKHLSFKEQILGNSRAFEKIEALSFFLYDNFFNERRAKGKFSKKACLGTSEKAAINIISSVALDNNKNGCDNIKFAINNDVFYVELCAIKNELSLHILEITNEHNYDITFLKDTLSVNLLTRIVNETLSLNFVRVNNREKRREYARLVELTNDAVRKKIFIAKENGKYFITGKHAIYDIEISFNPEKVYKKDIATKQAVRDYLSNVDTSLQDLMFLWRF